MNAFIERYSQHILIKAIDNFYDIYSIIIPINDQFVVNFCGRNLEKMEKLLQDYELENCDGFMTFNVKNPIILSYRLEKEITDEIGKKMRMELLQPKKKNSVAEYIFVPFARGNLKYLRKNTKKLRFCRCNSYFTDSVELSLCNEDMLDFSFFSQFPEIKELGICLDLRIKKCDFPQLNRIYLYFIYETKEYKNLQILSEIDEIYLINAILPDFNKIGPKIIFIKDYNDMLNKNRDPNCNSIYSLIQFNKNEIKLHLNIEKIIYENSPAPVAITNFERQVVSGNEGKQQIIFCKK